MSAGFSYPFESVLLQRSEFRFVEARLVEGARAGGSPVFAMTIGAFCDLVPRLRLSGGGVGRRFMVSGTGDAPGGL